MTWDGSKEGIDWSRSTFLARFRGLARRVGVLRAGRRAELVLHDSLISCFDAKQVAGGRQGAADSECTFWTRCDGQMCAQYFRPSGDVTYEPHTHSEYTLVVCLAGAVSKTQFGGNCVVGRGGAVMGNFGVEHASAYLRDGEPCEAVSLTVNRKALDQLLAEFQLPLPHENARPVFLGSLENPILSRSAEELARELQARDRGHKVVIQGLGMRMLVEALRAWPRSQVDRCEVDARPRLPRRDFVRAYEFMRWCRKDAFRLKHLCEAGR